MTNQKISASSALELLRAGNLDSSYEVEFSELDRVEATDAIKLGAIGIDVPEVNIFYDDDKIAADEAFEGEWIPITSDMEHYKKRLLIKLNVEEEIENWLSVSDIDLDALVSELLTGFYRSSKIIKR